MKKIIFTLLATLSILNAAVVDVSTTFDDVGTDYNNTQTVIYSDNGNLDVSLYNLFLGFIEQARPDLTLNKGPFAAKILDKQSNEKYDVIADVTRVDNDSPMYIKMWFNMSGDIIYTQFRVDEAPSISYPFGVWSFKYSFYLINTSTSSIDGMAAASKSGDNQRLENIDSSPDNLSLEFNPSTKEGVSDANGSIYRYNQYYMDYNDTHYADALNVSSYEIYEYALFDRNGSKVELTTNVNFSFNNNGIQYYGWEDESALHITDASTFSDVNLSSGNFDDITVNDYDGNSYTITDNSGVRKLYKNGTTVSYQSPLNLISDVDIDLTATFYGDYLDAWDSTKNKAFYFENGHHFNAGEYYIKQVYGIKVAQKVLKSSVTDNNLKPSTTSTISTSTLSSSDVKTIIGDIPSSAPLLLKYGKEL